MNKNIIIMVIFALITTFQGAALTLSDWDFDNHADNLYASDSQTSQNMNLRTNGGLALASATVSGNPSYLRDGASWNDTMSAVNWTSTTLAQAIGAGNYLSLNFSASSGTSMDLTSLKLVLDANGTGTYVIFTSVNGFDAGNEIFSGNISSSGTTQIIDLSGSQYDDLSSLEIRIMAYGFSAFSDRLCIGQAFAVDGINDIELNGEIIASAQYQLTVESEHGTPAPFGTNSYTHGTTLTNSVNAVVVDGFTQYTCSGWAMSGNSPSTGSSNSFAMTITNTPVTLKWLWETNTISEPVLSVAPQALSFDYNVGEAAPSLKTFSVTNIGPGTVVVSNAWNEPWLSVSPEQSESLSSGQGATFSVSISTNGLITGTSNAIITVYGPGAGNSPQTVNVQLKIRNPDYFDWPVHGSDNHHDFYTGERLEQPLKKAWIYKAQPAAPGFTFVGKEAYQSESKFNPIEYDRSPSTIAVAGRVYVASSSDEAVFCLDGATGTNIWTFYTEGAVRLAPSYANGKIYFGSDDGHAYCIDAIDGSEIWKVAASTNQASSLMLNGRMSSAWPVRTGVTVDGDNAYFGGGILAPQGSYLCSVNAQTGALNWRQQVQYTLQGYILPTTDKLYIGTGRTAPMQYDKASGMPYDPTLPSGRNRSGGGTGLSLVNGWLSYGPDETGVLWTRVSEGVLSSFWGNNVDLRIPGSFALFQSRLRMADNDRMYFLHIGEKADMWIDNPNSLLAVPLNAASNLMVTSASNFDSDGGGFNFGMYQGARKYWYYSANKLTQKTGEPRLTDEFLNLGNKSWEVLNAPILSGLLSPNAIYVGGSNTLHAYNPTNGTQLWAATVTGNVWNLSLANGGLYASTDEGYVYCFRADGSGSVNESAPTYTSPYPTNDALYDLYVEAATLVASNVNVTKGFCLLLGAEEGRLAYEIAMRSDLFVIGLETDPTKTASAREKLAQAGVYGSRVVIHDDMDELFPHPDYFAGVITSEELLIDGTMPYSSREIFRMLRPYGGIVLFGNKDGNLDLTSWVGDGMTAWSSIGSANGITWQIAERDAPEGFGDWRFQLGDSGNSLCSGDQYVGLDLEMLWFTQINPEQVLNRHFLAGAPVSAKGRMVQIGLDHLTAFDIYSGEILWERAVPKTLRQIAPLEAPMMYMSDDMLYVASSNTCLLLDAGDGSQKNAFIEPLGGHHWGYVGMHSNILVGSSQDAQASADSTANLTNLRGLYAVAGGGTHPTVSKAVFGKNPTTGSTLWTYTNGVVLNSSFAIGGTNIFFAESRNSSSVNDADGRVSLVNFFNSQAYLVALDINSGNVVWEVPLSGFGGTDEEEAFSIGWSPAYGGRLITAGSYWENSDINDATYELKVLDDDNGSQIGSTVTLSDGYGGQNDTDHNGVLMRPFIIGSNAYLRLYKDTQPDRISLADGSHSVMAVTGAVGQKGCTPPAASDLAFFYRAYAIEGVEVSSGQAKDITATTRPSCWLSILPVGGVLAMPEGSGGCNCGMAFQNSMAMAPKLTDTAGPNLFNVVAIDDTTIVAVFDEAVKATSVTNLNTWSIDNGITLQSAARQTNHLERVTLTVSSMPSGTNTLAVSAGVQDLYGNTASSHQMSFESGANDIDGDGLPDTWEQQYFENSTDADPNEDSDQDGLSNYDEYIAGTDPTSAFSSLVIENIVEAPGANGFVVSWTPQQNRTYSVLWAPDLSTSFTQLVENIAYPQNSWTDNVNNIEDGGFYKIEATK